MKVRLIIVSPAVRIGSHSASAMAPATITATRFSMALNRPCESHQKTIKPTKASRIMLTSISESRYAARPSRGGLLVSQDAGYLADAGDAFTGQHQRRLLHVEHALLAQSVLQLVQLP